jgi:hypothetical protein
MERPRLEVLWWRGCPSWRRAVETVRDEMASFGLDPSELTVTEIETEDDAAREGFVGSPTVRVDGRDVQPPGSEPAGLTCRVYRRRDNRVSPLPDPEDVRDAIAAALEGDKE